MIKGVLVNNGVDVDALYVNSILISTDFSSNYPINPNINLASGGSLPVTEYFYKIVALATRWIVTNGDTHSQLSNIDLVTTSQTRLFWRLTSSNGLNSGILTLLLSTDPNGSKVVAIGSRTGNGVITLYQKTESGIYGKISVAYSQDTMGSTNYFDIRKNVEVGYEEVNATTTSSDKSCVLTWDNITDVSEYRIYRGTATGIYDGFFSVGTNTFTDDGTQHMAFDTKLKISKVLGTSKIYLPAKVNDDDYNLTQSKLIIRMESGMETIPLDVTTVTNQPTWNDGTLQGLTQAEIDFNEWLTL